MKIAKKLFFSIAAITALTAFSVPNMLTLSSCSKKNESNEIDQNVKKNLLNFIETTHARWSGNLSNYNKDSIKYQDFKTTNTTKKKIKVAVGLNENPKLNYTLETSKNNPNINNYGSIHSFSYLLKEAKTFLNIKDEITVKYPNEATITLQKETQNTLTKTTSDTKFPQLQVANNSEEYRISFKENTTDTPGYIKSVIFNATNLKTSSGDVELINKLKDTTKNSINVQGFLWNGQDRVNDWQPSYNNRGQNIIITIPTTNSSYKTNAKDFYVVAHYDSTASGANKSSWGASDNGTGVATVLSLIQHFSNPQNTKNLPVNLRFVFADGEEVGVLGTNALVHGVLNKDKTLKDNCYGMIDLDTVGGGDNLYVHSSNSSNKNANSTWNFETTIRDQLNGLSRIRASVVNDMELELQIHPQLTPTEYKAGETGDWSDHYPFYQTIGCPIAYIEATNFQVLSHSNAYDGYAQTYNKNAWLDANGKPTVLNVEKLNETELVVYNPPDSVSDYIVSGDIWHSDLDTLNWYQKYFGDKIYKQTSTVFKTLVMFFDTLTTIIATSNSNK